MSPSAPLVTPLRDPGLRDPGAELGRNKFEDKASEFQDLEKAFWVG